jgi:glyoxylase-like metal-dependent hydrolase (beta-lactamase superfamily II)
MKLFSFNIANFKVDGGAMFGVVPRLIWSRYVKPDEDNLIPLALRSLLVETDNRLILIDNGIGDKQDEKFYRHLNIYGGDGLEGGIRKAGFTFSHITDVLLTHLHFDHCGGSIRINENGKYTATFPNAKYWVSRQQWENAMDPNPREADSFLEENLLPMRDLGVLNLIEEDGELAPGVELRLVHGHTPGQIVPVIRYNGKTLVFGADLFPMAAHIPVKYNMAYDLEVMKTMNEKENFLKEIVENDYTLFFEHDTERECGKVEVTKKGYRLKESFSLDNFTGSLSAHTQPRIPSPESRVPNPESRIPITLSSPGWNRRLGDRRVLLI